MSYKIYSAYQYIGNIFELKSFLDTVRDSQIEESLTMLKDFGRYYEINEKTRWLTIERILNKIVKSQENDPLNFEASIIIAPHKEKIVLILFGVHKNTKSLFSSENKCLDYSYVDNTDKPESIPDDEWEDRYNFYESLADISDQLVSFRNQGFVYELWNQDINNFISMEFIKRKEVN